MRVDLEDLAAGYSHRPPSAAALQRPRRAGASADLGPGDVAVDVGGGRGDHAAPWAEFGAVPIVADASRGMTQVAAAQGVLAMCASSQALPLRSATAKLVYFHLSLHYGDWRRSIDEAMRIRRPDGELWIWTMGEAHHRSSILAKWFPSVGDIDAARFPDPALVVDYLTSMAMIVETAKEIEHKEVPASTWRAAVEARFISTLQLIPPAEFAAGLASFDSAHPDPSTPVEYDLTFDWIRARP